MYSLKSSGFGDSTNTKCLKTHKLCIAEFVSNQIYFYNSAVTSNQAHDIFERLLTRK